MMERNHMFAAVAVVLVLMIICWIVVGRPAQSGLNVGLNGQAEGLQKALGQIEATCEAMGYIKK